VSACARAERARARWPRARRRFARRRYLASARIRPRASARLRPRPRRHSPACSSSPLPPAARSGLDNAGKTTILKKFNGEDISSISPTLGFNIQSLEYGGYLLNVWDVGGQTTLRAYWRNYFEATDGLIWVVDSADRRRLGDCRAELRALLSQEKLAGASVLVLANKQDLHGALTAADIAAALGLGDEAFARGRHWAIHACSAVTGAGLIDGVHWLVGDISSRIFLAE
jgi:ADP-ribosylation factor-like protein 2